MFNYILYLVWLGNLYGQYITDLSVLQGAVEKEKSGLLKECGDHFLNSSVWALDWLSSLNKYNGISINMTVVQDYLNNSKSSNSFECISPLVIEMNIIMQAIGGEYNDYITAWSKALPTTLQSIANLDSELGKIVHGLEKRISGAGMVVELHNRIYHPEKDQNGIPVPEKITKRSSGLYEFVHYLPKEAATLVEVHKKWIEEKSNNLLSETLKENLFKESRRIYSSVIWFHSSGSIGAIGSHVSSGLDSFLIHTNT